MPKMDAMRTQFPQDQTKVVYIVPDTGAPSGVQQKWGKNVFYFRDWTNAIGACESGRGDHILFYPGSYTLTAALAVSKKDVTIRSLTGNPESVNIDGTGGFTCFNVTEDGVTLRDMTITVDDAASTPADGVIVAAAADSGCTIDNCYFVGADKDVIGIDSEGNRLKVTNCRFEDIAFANIQSNGENCVFENNFFQSDNATFKGIELTAGSWSVIKNNIFGGTGGTSDYGVYLAATCKLVAIIDNVYHATLNIDTEVLSGATPYFKGNEETGTTATIAYVVGTTS